MWGNKSFENTLDSDFREWLQQDDYSTPFIHPTDKASIIVIKVRKSDNFDYLFTQRNYICNGVERNNNFEYAGIYFKQTGLVYDEQYNLNTLIYINQGTSKNNLLEQLKQNVREKIDSLINNNKNNLNEIIQDIEEISKSILIYIPEVKSTARRYFLNYNFNIDDLVFECDYEPENWWDESLLSYIEDPENYIEQEVKEYIEDNQRNILRVLNYIDLLKIEYKKLEEDTSNSTNILRKILYGIDHNNAKTVRVTICIDGKEFSFKSHASVFKFHHVDFGYSILTINKKERNKLIELFGDINRYCIEDIVSVTYKKQILYCREK